MIPEVPLYIIYYLPVVTQTLFQPVSLKYQPGKGTMYVGKKDSQGMSAKLCFDIVRCILRGILNFELT